MIEILPNIYTPIPCFCFVYPVMKMIKNIYKNIIVFTHVNLWLWVSHNFTAVTLHQLPTGSLINLWGVPANTAGYGILKKGCNWEDVDRAGYLASHDLKS